MLKSLLKKLIRATQDFTGKTSVSMRMLSDQNGAVIFNFHQIGIADGSFNSPLDQRVFRAFVSFVSQNCNVINLSDIRRRKNSEKLNVVFSFDDGYKDFLTNALPVLQELDIPSNLNIVPDCVMTGNPPLNIRFAELLRITVDNPAKLDGIVRGLGLRNTTLPELHRATLNTRFSRLIEIYEDLGSLQESTPVEMLTVRDIQGLPDSVEVGCHSYEHACLTAEDNEYFSKDTKKCIEYFENVLGFRPKIYAFPYGKYNEQHVRHLQQESFSHILGVSEKPYFEGDVINRVTAYGESLPALKYNLFSKPAGEI